MEGSGKRWALTKDSASQIYEFTTDGTWLYSTVPWGEGHTCWQLRYDGSGRPVGMTLVRADLGKSAAATDS